MATEYDELHKYLLLGSRGVGKTKILLRYADDDYTEPYYSNIGVDFKFKELTISGKKIKLMIWDLAPGGERFRTITSSYYRGMHGTLLIFDLTDKDCFQTVKYWLQEIEKNVLFQDVPVVLVGAKKDASRVIDQYEAMQFATSLGLPYVEVSSKTGEGINEAFSVLVKRVREVVPAVASVAYNSPGSKMVPVVLPQKKKGVFSFLK